MKSNIFHESLKYAPLLNKNPNPKILKHISIVYKTKNTVSTAERKEDYSSVVGLSKASVILFRMITVSEINSKVDDFIIL